VESKLKSETRGSKGDDDDVTALRWFCCGGNVDFFQLVSDERDKSQVQAQSSEASTRMSVERNADAS
jgi:hypothetical protein